jgi:hypothetical protein
MFFTAEPSRLPFIHFCCAVRILRLKELQNWPLDDRERNLHIFTEFMIFSPDGSRIVLCQYRTDVEIEQDIHTTPARLIENWSFKDLLGYKMEICKVKYIISGKFMVIGPRCLK